MAPATPSPDCAGYKVDPPRNVSLGVDVQPISGVADSGRLTDDLAALFEALGETARDLGTGVIVLIDELQEARDSAKWPYGQAPRTPMMGLSPSV